MIERAYGFRLILMTAVLLAVPVVHAGAWGTGAFENDDALDFVYELQEYDAYEMLRSSFGKDCSSSAYIDAWVGARAIASAEVIAAVRGNAASDLPEDLADVIASLEGRMDTELVSSATSCVKNVLDVERSELAQLWQETEEHDAWQGAVKKLLERLRK